jgi:hypothetical protein
MLRNIADSRFPTTELHSPCVLEQVELMLEMLLGWTGEDYTEFA